MLDTGSQQALDTGSARWRYLHEKLTAISAHQPPLVASTTRHRSFKTDTLVSITRS